MFHEFLSENRSYILALVRQKAVPIEAKKSSSDIYDKGLPLFFDSVTNALKQDAEPFREIKSVVTLNEAARYGKELLHLGYTISQVVHLYGIVCQSVMETVTKKDFNILGPEFRRFNMCFDDSIAAAVTEYEKNKTNQAELNENEKLGFLVHELRNMVTSAHLSLQMIRKGVVGISGSTGGVLERSLNRMRELIDRTLNEVRLMSQSPKKIKLVRLIDVTGEVEAVILNEAGSKEIQMYIDVNPESQVNTNPDDLFSAFSNIVQNAVKFTPQGGKVWIRSTQTEDSEIIEVEDECGGLAEGKMDEIFTAFVQSGEDRSGLGLGLTIAKRAIKAHGGDITVRNLSGKGCIFSISLPRILPSPMERRKGLVS